MKRIISILLVMALLFTFAYAEDTPEALFKLFINGEYEELYELSGGEVQSSLQSPADFGAMWEQIHVMFGDIISYEAGEPVEQPPYTAVYFNCDCTLATATISIVANAEGKLAGLSIVGFNYKLDDSQSESYNELPIVLREGAVDETNGMLTLPEGEGPFPCVIMAQGSGSSDMNEMAYGMPVFRDLARGLADNGVASIRYDKYPFAHADLITPDFTVYEEYIIDAQSAASMLDADERISDVYILGHSMGAMLAPRIMDNIECEKLKGAVLVAGTTKHLWEIMVRQYRDAHALRDIEPEYAAELEATLQAEIDKLESMKGQPDEVTQAEVVFGATAYYLLDEISVDPAEVAIRLGYPLLIVQGGKDWQVKPDDGIELWKAALEGMDNVSYLYYPDMTHMLFDLQGEYTASIADYANPQSVSAKLMEDIADWILNG